MSMTLANKQWALPFSYDDPRAMRIMCYLTNCQEKKVKAIEHLLKAGWGVVPQYNQVLFVDPLPQKIERGRFLLPRYQKKQGIFWLNAVKVQEKRKFWRIRLIFIQAFDRIRRALNCFLEIRRITKRALKIEMEYQPGQWVDITPDVKGMPHYVRN